VCQNLKNQSLFIIIIIIFFSSILIPVYAQTNKLGEGDVLLYSYVSLGSGVPSQVTGDAIFSVLFYNQTTLIFGVETEGFVTETFNYTINYDGGIPVYAERLEGLIYLPPECLVETLNGNLEWLSKLETETTSEIITGQTSHTLNYTVGAGTFQSINITLPLRALGYYGDLSLIYDLDSGILIYSDWIPTESGDRIIHVLIDISFTSQRINPIFNLFSLITILFIPVLTVTHQTYSKYIKTPLIEKEESQEKLNITSFSGKTIYLITVGAFLNLLSFFIPWSVFSNIEIYLPFSPPLIVIDQIEFTNISYSFNLISLLAHVAIILIWLGIALQLYFTKKLIYQLMIILSAILNIVAVVFLIQSGWTSYWGSLINLIGAIIVVVGILVSNIKVEVVTQEPEFE
jgi:hypothetical protein